MKRNLLLLTTIVLMLTSASAVEEASYDGSLQVDILNGENFSPGGTLQAELTASNSEDGPIVGGYIVVNVVKGEEPYYPSQKSDRSNVFHQEKITGIDLKSGNLEEIEYDYELPEDLESGDYHLQAYFKTNRTPVEGIPFIYSAPVSEDFVVEGEGDQPQLKISRTETYLTGTEEVIGDWDPDTVNFNGTMWPSLTGPVGVFTTDSMDNIQGSVRIENQASVPQQATLNVMICEWDDTSCTEEIDSLEKAVSVGSSGTSVPVEIENPSEPDAYAVKITVSSLGETQSIYRNRVIREGNTSRIRKLSVNRPYIGEGEKLSVELLAGASPDHYTDPSALDVEASVTVETLDGRELLKNTKSITRLSNSNVFEKVYFNKTLRNAVSEYRVSAELRADGELWDSHSYVVDYSDFDNSLENVTMESYNFGNRTLNVELCGRTSSGAPALGEIQTILMKNGSVEGSEKRTLDGCGEFSYSDISGEKHSLMVNYGSQTRFVLEPERESSISIPSGGNLPLPYIIIAVIIILTLVGYLSIQGDSK